MYTYQVIIILKKTKFRSRKQQKKKEIKVSINEN